MDESQLPAELRRKVSERIRNTKKQRLQMVQDFVRGDFAMLADAEQIAKRLNAKGQHAQARRVDELSGQLKRIRSLPVEERSQDESLAETNRIVHESIVGSDDMLSVRFLHRGSEVAGSVARIVTMPHQGVNGTGFLISPRLLMTNHHVIRNQDEARNNVAEFKYGDEVDGDSATFRFRPDDFFATSHFNDLDCTVVAVEPFSGETAVENFGWCALAARSDAIQKGERVNIIHHPAGGLKQVSIRDNFVAAEAPDQGPKKYWLYASDTKRGSSGSPVFNELWNVVALHHAGLEIDDPEEVAAYRQILQSSGVSGLRSNPSSIEINEGVQIDSILRWLEFESISFDSGMRALYQQFLATNENGIPKLNDRPRPQTNSKTIVTPNVDLAEDSGAVTVNMYFGGGAIKTIQPVSQTAAPRTAAPQAAASSQNEVDLKRTLELFKNQATSQKSVFTALGVLQGMRESDYLPTNDQIQEQKAEYYSDLINSVANDLLSSSELYDQLHTLSNDNLRIVRRFPESLRDLESLVGARRNLESGTEYARARAFIYTDVDLQPHRMLQCPYTGAIIAPEQLMLRDLIKELDMDDLLPQRFRNNRYLNCEHIVPQSWFKEDHPNGVSDLHHLIAADGGANHFRSDCPFREVNGQGDLGPANNPAYIPKAGHKHQRTFEPAMGKPVVARATLYFILTYQGALDNSKYDSADIDMLKEWSKSSPPSDYEMHRNVRAAQAQGNRNPLIDFPEWVDKIDFMQGIA